MRDFCSYIHSMNRTYAYLRNDREIKFRMVSAQHFVYEAPGVEINEKEFIALSDMCRVPALLTATFTNVYKTSGNPVCL